VTSCPDFQWRIIHPILKTLSYFESDNTSPNSNFVQTCFATFKHANVTKRPWLLKTSFFFPSNVCCSRNQWWGASGAGALTRCATGSDGSCFATLVRNICTYNGKLTLAMRLQIDESHDNPLM
jgi:hypothetical protein